MRRALVLVFVLSACTPEVGPCDEPLSLELVYDPAGNPAFAGQAIFIRQCGDGSFCHAEGVPAGDRWQAPMGLEFDVRIASTTGAGNIEGIDRLARHQLNVIRERDLVWEQVYRGLMPPPGTTQPMGVAEPTSRYERVGDDGVTFSPLPDLEDEATRDEAREIVRNWLACGAPVVERSVPREDNFPSTVGREVPACERDCVDLTWSALYAEVIAPGCATASCHDADAPAAELDLSGDAVAAHARMLDAPAAGTACVDSGIPMLTAGDSGNSLFSAKLDPDLPPCGGRMPDSGNPLSEQRRCAIEAWIDCGACVDDADMACLSCIEGRRADCGVQIVDGQAECLTQAPCTRFAEPP